MEIKRVSAKKSNVALVNALKETILASRKVKEQDNDYFQKLSDNASDETGWESIISSDQLVMTDTRFVCEVIEKLAAPTGRGMNIKIETTHIQALLKKDVIENLFSVNPDFDVQLIKKLSSDLVALRESIGSGVSPVEFEEALILAKKEILNDLYPQLSDGLGI